MSTACSATAGRARRGDGLIEPPGLVVADEIAEERGQLGVVGVERVLAVIGKLGGLAGVAQRAAGVVEHVHRRVEACQRGQHAVHPLLAVGFRPQRVAVEDQRGADPRHALGGDVLEPPRRLVFVDPVVGVVERGLDPGRVANPHGGLADRQRIALGAGQRRRREPAAQLRRQRHRVGSGVEQVDQRIALVQRDRFQPAEELHGLPGGHHACADQLPGLQLAAARPLTHLVRVAGAHVAHGDALAGVHLLDLEHRPAHQQPLLRQQPLVVGQQRPAHLEELRERAALEQHRVQNQRIGQRVGIIVGVAAAFVARLGQQVVPAGQHRVLAGLRVQPAHPLGQWQLLAADLAFLVLAAGPAPARLVAAEVAARLGPVLLQQLHQRMVRLGAGAAQQRQPALDVAAIGGDAGQIEARQRPVRIHRLGRQQLAFGRVDVADPLQRHRA